MSWIRTAGKRSLAYRRLARLAWRRRGVLAAAAARRVAATAPRRMALKHADRVVEGAMVEVFDQGAAHWVVFSAGSPVASYPAAPGRLGELVADVDLSKKMTPDQWRARRADRSRRRRVLATLAGLRSQLRRRRDSW